MRATWNGFRSLALTGLAASLIWVAPAGAAVQLRGLTGNTTGISGSTTWTSSTPNSTQAGDVLVVVLSAGGNFTWTPPTGWTAGPRTNSGQSAWTFWRVANDNEPASYTFTASGSTANGE